MKSPKQVIVQIDISILYLKEDYILTVFLIKGLKSLLS